MSYSLWAFIIPYVAALLAHLAGLVVAIILLVRARSTPAILSLVGFALLSLLDITRVILSAPPIVASITWDSTGWLWFLNCCCSIFDIAAIVCLIVAIWQAVSGTAVTETMHETWGATASPEEVPGDSAGIWGESPEDIAGVTDVLEGTLEDVAEISEAPQEDPRATRILEETQAGTTETLGETVEESE